MNDDNPNPVPGPVDPNDNPDLAPGAEHQGSQDLIFRSIDYIVIGVCLVFCGAAIFLPGLVVTPFQQTILSFLVAILGAILMGRQAEAYFKMTQPTFVLTIAGVWVIIFVTMVLINQLAKPQMKLAVFSFFHEGMPVPLDRQDAITLIESSASGGNPSMIKEGNKLALNFPTQVFDVSVKIVIPSGIIYRGTLNYEGTQESSVHLGNDDEKRFKRVN